MKLSIFTAKLVLVLGVLLLAACSTGKIVQSYEGDVLQAAELSVLTAPENIVVLSINGKKVKKYLLSDLNVRYGLKPGQNLVVFQYESVWAKAIRAEQDAPRSEKVVSAPKEVLIDAKAGENLHFSFKNVGNVRAAKDLAAEFDAELLDEKLNVVARSAELGTYDVGEDVALPVKAKLRSGKKEGLSEAGTLQTLDALKVLWGTATADEKKEFLSWAFQK